MTAFGQSKHRAKEEARASGAKTWHEVGQHLKIYSYNTANLYRSVWVELLRFAKQYFDIKNITYLSPLIVHCFLDAKISEGLKYGSFTTYCAALEKLAIALYQWSQDQRRRTEYNWSDAISAAKKEASGVLDRFVKTRAYRDPIKLIEAISNPVYQIIAATQYSIGARISELDHVKPSQFLKEGKLLIINGKGGKERVSKFRHLNVFDKYQQLVKENLNSHYGKFIFNRNQYRLALQVAADKTGQQYTGSHGLRWNFAQERFQAIQQSGGTREQALAQVAQEMGHNRGDITEHYLRY